MWRERGSGAYRPEVETSGFGAGEGNAALCLRETELDYGIGAECSVPV